MEAYQTQILRPTIVQPSGPRSEQPRQHTDAARFHGTTERAKPPPLQKTHQALHRPAPPTQSPPPPESPPAPATGRVLDDIKVRKPRRVRIIQNYYKSLYTSSAQARQHQHQKKKKLNLRGPRRRRWADPTRIPPQYRIIEKPAVPGLHRTRTESTQITNACPAVIE